MKLSERLEAAVERLYEDGMDTRGIADLFRESAELARRVEGAPVMSVSMVAEGHAVGMYLHPTTDAGAAHELTGQRVRIVPEQGEGVAGG